MTDRDNDAMDIVVLEAALALRASSPPGIEWRDRLLKAVAAEPPPRPVGYRWSVRPAHAIAACFACAVLGGAVVWAVQRPPVSAEGIAAEAVTSSGIASDEERLVRFELLAPAARRVTIVGDFNAWDPRGHALERARNGVWAIAIPLAPGRYVYSFMIDGRLTPDPRAPRSTDEDFGSPSSTRLVSGP